LLIALAVVGAGLLIVGFGRNGWWTLALGGLIMGCGGEWDVGRHVVIPLSPTEAEIREDAALMARITGMIRE
jgi:hypothetical protein